MSFIPVLDITNFAPMQVSAGVEYKLSAEVEPLDAANQSIEWSLVSGNATIVKKSDDQYYLTAHKSEEITVMATIRNGTLAD